MYEWISENVWVDFGKCMSGFRKLIIHYYCCLLKGCSSSDESPTRLGTRRGASALIKITTNYTNCTNLPSNNHQLGFNSWNVTVQRISFLSRLRREIFQIFANQTNPHSNNYKDLTDLNRFVGFLPDRVIRWIVTVKFVVKGDPSCRICWSDSF